MLFGGKLFNDNCRSPCIFVKVCLSYFWMTSLALLNKGSFLFQENDPVAVLYFSSSEGECHIIGILLNGLFEEAEIEELVEASDFMKEDLLTDYEAAVAARRLKGEGASDVPHPLKRESTVDGYSFTKGCTLHRTKRQGCKYQLGKKKVLRFSKIQLKDEEIEVICGKLGAVMEAQIHQYLPSTVLDTMQKRASSCSIGGSIFCGLTFNEGHAQKLHKDSNNMKGGCTAILTHHPEEAPDQFLYFGDFSVPRSDVVGLYLRLPHRSLLLTKTRNVSHGVTEALLKDGEEDSTQRRRSFVYFQHRSLDCPNHGRLSGGYII